MTDADDSLCGSLRESCDRATASIPTGRAREAIAEVRERLAGELLRVAVGGRLNAGKSTLVNALLGEKLAATDATECTKLVSWFSYGLINEVVIRVRDGQPVRLPAQPLANAIAKAGRPAEDIAGIEVHSSNKTLATEYTLVDTPGLDSLTGLDEMSLSALGQADVLLYVMPHPGENDVEALTALKHAAGGAGITALSTIGVLSRIDQLGSGTGDPWPDARRLAQSYGDQLAALVETVVPVLGLLAETVLGDRFTEDDMTPLRALHRFRAADRETLDWALSSGQDFLDEPAVPLSQEQRARLLSLLGSHGIKTAMDALDAGTAGASALLAVLRAHSGIDVLLGQLRRQFIDRADPLRARRAIQALDALTWLGVNPAETAALTKLREELDEVREHPRLRQFALMDSLTELNSGRWQAPDGAEAELAALATGIDLADQLGIDPAAAPAGIRELLVKRITAWHILENTSSRVTYRHARAVREYLESLFRTVPPE